MSDNKPWLNVEDAKMPERYRRIFALAPRDVYEGPVTPPGPAPDDAFVRFLLTKPPTPVRRPKPFDWRNRPALGNTNISVRSVVLPMTIERMLPDRDFASEMAMAEMKKINPWSGER